VSPQALGEACASDHWREHGGIGGLWDLGAPLEPTPEHYAVLDMLCPNATEADRAEFRRAFLWRLRELISAG